MSQETPITFAEDCYCLLDTSAQAVPCTAIGLLAIFSTLEGAKGHARLLGSHIMVVPVAVRPIPAAHQAPGGLQ